MLDGGFGGGSAGRLTGWLAGWPAGRPAGWVVGWQGSFKMPTVGAFLRFFNQKYAFYAGFTNILSSLRSATPSRVEKHE